MTPADIFRTGTTPTRIPPKGTAIVYRDEDGAIRRATIDSTAFVGRAGVRVKLTSDYTIDTARLEAIRVIPPGAEIEDARGTILWRLADATSRRGFAAMSTMTLLADCAAEIRQRDATIAELRGWVAALESMTPGGGR